VCHIIVQGYLSSSIILSEPALLLDPDLMDDRTSIATAESTSQGDFRQRVTDRDGACVLTRNEENLVACHIVPRSKTHQVCSEEIS
jgi:nicotinamide mononucleotide (NMN) deamidase PncC